MTIESGIRLKNRLNSSKFIIMSINYVIFAVSAAVYKVN